MSQSTAKPSGSLSAIETYGSDDSDLSEDGMSPPPPTTALDMSEASSADVTAEPPSESAPESAEEPEPTAESSKDPVSEPVAEPVAEPAADPITESTTEPNPSTDAQLEESAENPSSSKTPEKAAESDDDSSSGSSSDDDSSDDDKDDDKDQEKANDKAEQNQNHDDDDDVKAEDKIETEVKDESSAPQDNSEVVIEPAVAKAVTLTTEEPSVDSETSKSVSPEAPASPGATPADSPPVASPARASSASPAVETKTEESPAVDSPAVASTDTPAPESPAASPVVADVKAEDVADEPMDTEEKPDVDEEEKEDDDDDDDEEDDNEESEAQPAEGSSENPWESPKQTPINGVVQPRTSPPRGKPTRHTNCLDFVLFTVIKDALKHKHSWPFQTPVDAEKLEIPTYHDIVTKPMDLRTIERRLRNLYYWSAEDAIKDIKQLFANCYSFNPPEYDIFKMAKTLEKQVLSQLTQLPRTEKPAELADHYRRGMFPASTPNGKTKTPKQRGRKSTRGRKKGSIGRAAMKIDDDDMADDESKVDSLNFDDEDDITEKDAESRAESVQPEPEEQKPSTSTVAAPSAKKRKLENGSDNGVPAKVASPAPASSAAAAAAPPPPPRKNPNTMIDWKSLVPRFHGKQAEWQKFCSKLLTEIHSVRNKSFALVFYQPVDPIKLKIFDYLDIITNPMDLQTIKKKLDYKQYAEPEEFEQDMNLMVENCCKYNPKGSVVHQNALDMKTFFDSRWKLCPRPGADPIIAETYITQNLVVNTDLVEDEKINNYIAAVKAEEKKCAEKLEELRNMNTDLYKIAVQRRDARLAGNPAPSLEATQIAQLDKLGITIKPTTIVPELISPALSVRSSSRAPVPKIIDDIGPSPIKARKISKPRQSNASAASVAMYVPPPTSNRGRKPKGAGRPKKIPYSPNATPPHAAAYIPPRDHQKPYVSIYGKTTVTNKDKMELSTKMANITHEFITPVLRIIQISQYNFGKKVSSLRTLCEDEIDFNDVEDDLVLELIDYLEMIKKDRPRAEIARQELEHKAKYYGFVEFDQTSGFMNLKKRKVEPAPPPAARRVASDSPSPSASRTGAPSSDSDSESDSSDSDSPIQHTANRTAASFKRRSPPVRVTSRGSTPALATSQPATSKAASSKPAAPARPPVKAKDVSPSGDAYKKRTLSESSSSDDDDEKSSSDSSDSDSSEPKPKPVAAPPPAKKPMVKKAPPPKPQKKPPMTILDELLPETPSGSGPSAPSSSGTARQMMTPSTMSLSPQLSMQELKAQQEQEHNEALRRREEARRRRAAEDQPMMHQQEVMQAFESQYGDFTY